MLIGIALPILAISTTNAAKDPGKVTTVGGPVTPYKFTGSLKDLPLAVSWKEGDPIKEIPRRRFAAKNAQSNDYKMSKDPLAELQKNTANSAGRGFDTTILNFEGLGFTGVNPPDPVGDIGKDYFIQSINGSGGSIFSIYNKLTGVVEVGPIVMGSLAPNSSACSSGSGDPIILYDESAKRWFMQEFVSGGNDKLCFYISSTSDPINGGWNFYEFTGATFPDYPHFGIWSDAYLGTANENPATVYAFDRTNMLAGTTARAAQVIVLGDLPGYGFQTATPVDWDSDLAPPAGAPGIIMRHIDEEAHSSFPDNPATDLLEMYNFVVDFDNSSNSVLNQLANITITDFNSFFLDYSTFATVPQPNSTARLDAIREVILNRLQYWNFGTHESIIGVLPTNINPATTGSEINAGLRWFELRRVGGIANPWTLFQEGTYDPGVATENRLVGSLSIDKAGNIAMAYSKTNTDTNNPLSASLAYTGRLVSDPKDVMTQPEMLIKTGSGANTSGRWGDYASMSVDPVDRCTFWFTGEYQNGSDWGTSISSFKFDACDGPGFNASATPETFEVCTGSSYDAVINVASNQGYAEDVTLSFTNVPNFVANEVLNGTVVTAPGTSDLSFDIVTGGTPGTELLSVQAVGKEVPGASLIFFGDFEANDAGHPQVTQTFDISLVYADVPPIAATQTAPANGATNTAVRPTFSWNAVPTANSYTLEVGDSPAMTNIIFTTTVSSSTLSAVPNIDLPSNTTLYWRVNTVNACSGTPSSVFSFTTAPLPGDCPTGTSVNTVVSYDFEAGAQGWSSSALSGVNTWAVTANNPKSGVNSWQAEDPETIADQVLVSPIIALPLNTSPLTLQFWNRQEMEDSGGTRCWDGGILEISTDTGANFTQITGAQLLTDPYDGDFRSASNPLSGLNGWCGDPQAYLNSIVDLDTYAGQNVIFRFRLGSDGSVGRNPGWNIDDVSVKGCVAD